MELALKDRPEVEIPQPEGIVTVKIDPQTGLLAKPGQRGAIFEYFREENAPQESSQDQQAPNTPFAEQEVRDDLF